MMRTSLTAVQQTVTVFQIFCVVSLFIKFTIFFDTDCFVSINQFLVEVIMNINVVFEQNLIILSKSKSINLENQFFWRNQYKS